MQLIGLCGKMGAGKDTAAKILIDKFGFRRVAFGDFLRSEVCDYLDMFSDLYYMVAKHMPEDIDQIIRKYAYRGGSVYQKPYTPEIRRLLQFWGTEFRRKQDPDYWVKQLDHHISHFRVDDARFVITDVRFPNEVFFVRNNSGIVAEVVRDETIVYTDEKLNVHASENSLMELDIPVKIRNNGSIEELEQNVIQFFKDNFKQHAI